MRPLNDNVIPLQAAATVNSSVIWSRLLFSASAQLVATGSAAGTFKLQASNDDLKSANAAPTNWDDIPSATVSVSGGGAYLIPKLDICYEYIRAVYTNTGTGTISAIIKAIGA